MAGTVSVWIIDAIKKRRNITDRNALYLSIAVSVVLGIAVLVLSGKISSDNLSLETAPEVLAAVFAASQLVYQFIKQKSKA